MPEPLVVLMMRQFKLALLFREQAAMQEMARRWLGVEGALEAQITALAHEMRKAADAGETIKAYKLFQMDRYQRLLAQTQAEFGTYAGYADGQISGLQWDNARMGTENAIAAIEAAYSDGILPPFTRLPLEAVEFMVGNAGDGAPLGELLKLRMIRGPDGGMLPGVLDKLTEALVNGTALGRNPREVAKMMRDSLAGGLNKALVIARTEGLRPYRMASQMSYQASGVVMGHKRLTAHDDRVCAACLASEGQLLKVNEVMYDHPNGRCTSVPVVRGMPEIGWLSGENWLRTQEDHVQQQILGPSRWSAWTDGAFGLADVAEHTFDAVWGGSLRVKGLGELVD